MKFILTLFLLNALSSFSQIWKEPFDTMTYYDRLTRLNETNRDVTSYTVAQFDSSGTAVQFDYFEFNENGYLVKECNAVSADQQVDTIRYFYDQSGVFQEAVYPGGTKQNTVRKFVKDSLNRTVAVIAKSDSSQAATHFYYSTAGKLDSTKYETGRKVIYDYDEKGKLSKKTIIDNGESKEYTNYYFPKNNATTYCECHSFKIYNEPITACDSTIGTFNRSGKLSKIEMHVYKEDSPHFVYFKYDRKGRILKMKYEEPTGNASTVFFRTRKGLLTRIEHCDAQGRVYNYSNFVYQYR